MKKLLIPAVASLFILNACGPAAEDRVAMDRNAKRTSDSLARALDSCLMDPIKEINSGVAPIVTTTVAAPATATAQPK